MSAIQGRSPKEREVSDKLDPLRSPKATDSPEISRRADDRKDKEPKDKDKKERTKALDDLAPPVAPKASPTAPPTGVHHARTNTAPAVTRAATSGSMISRSSQSLSSSDGARAAATSPPADYSERRRLTMSSANASRASVSGASRTDAEDKPREKPRARDDEGIKEGHRERAGSFGANVDSVIKRPKAPTSPSPASPPPASISDLQIVKQPKPYADPRLSQTGAMSPDSKSSPSGIKSPTISRVSLAGDKDTRDAAPKEKPAKEKLERSDLDRSMKLKSERKEKGPDEADARPVKDKTKDRSGDADADARPKKDKGTKTDERDPADPEARPKKEKKREDEKEAPDPDARPKKDKKREDDTPDPDARPKKDKGAAKAQDESPDPDARPTKPRDADAAGVDLRASQSAPSGSRIQRASSANPLSSSQITRGSRIGAAPPPTDAAAPSTSPSAAAASPLAASASSPPAPAPAPTPTPPATTPAAAPAPALASPTAPGAPSLSASQKLLGLPTSVSMEKRGSDPNVAVPPAAKPKDDLSMGDRLKLFMNISPRATQSMVSLNSSQLQALRDKQKAAKATEPMDLKDVMLKMRDPNYGLELKETKIGFFSTKRCMTGQQFIDWLIAQKLTESGSRAEAVAIATALLNTGNIELAKAVNEKEKEGIFSDSLSLYTIAKSDDEKKRDKAAKEKDMHSPRGSSPRRRWFGSTLPDIMATQEPGEKVPRVATALLNAVLAMNGARTEGIFRISPEGSLIESLKEQLERGSLAIPGHDPHVPACCFKLFLRELRQPVIPDALYDDCIKAAENAAAAEAVLAKLPETNRNLLASLVSFLVDLAAPENVQVTKMPVSNLAVVFAPCLLRCPLTNPLDIMRNSSVEQMFVQTLIEAHCPPTYTRAGPVFGAPPRTIAIPLKDADGTGSPLSSSLRSVGSSPSVAAAAAGSGKNLAGSPATEEKRSSGKAQEAVQRRDTAGSSGSGKKLEPAAAPTTPAPAADAPTTAAPVAEAKAPAGEAKEAASSSGKNLDVPPKPADAATPTSTAPPAAGTPAPAPAPAVSEPSEAKAPEPPGVAKSEPVPIPGAAAASVASSASTSAPIASAPSHSPASSADVFSPPTSPAPAGAPATEADAAAATGPPSAPAPDASAPTDAPPHDAAPNGAPAAETADEVAVWLKGADTALAARLAPQLRDVKQRLVSAEAQADAELTTFYRQQLESLRRQLTAGVPAP